MNNTELKPCPFCGGKVELHSTDGNITDYFISCKECGCRQSGSISRQSVIDAWNTRKPMDNIVGELEELKTKYNKLREVCEDKIDAYELECKCIPISKDIEIVKRGGVE